jgi:hypothetical protein
MCNWKHLKMAFKGRDMYVTKINKKFVALRAELVLLDTGEFTKAAVYYYSSCSRMKTCIQEVPASNLDQVTG